MKYGKYTAREWTCIFGMVALLLWGFAGWQAYRNLQFDDRNVVATTGHVDSLHHFVGPRNDSHTVYFHYVAGNLLFFTSENVDEATWNSLRPGDSMPIKYRTSATYDCRIDLPVENARQARIPLGMGAVAAFFSILGIVFFWLHWKHSKVGRHGHHSSREPRLLRAIRAGWRGTYESCPPEEESDRRDT